MVIQRWQSVMLLISGIMMGIFSFMNLGVIQAADYAFNVEALGIFREGIATEEGEPTGISTIYLFIDSVLAMLLPLVGIFCFKNMKLQKNIIYISMLTIVTSAALLTFKASQFAGGLQAADGVNWSAFVGAPLVAIIADIVAIRLINSDIKRLRAADRLR